MLTACKGRTIKFHTIIEIVFYVVWGILLFTVTFSASTCLSQIRVCCCFVTLCLQFLKVIWIQLKSHCRKFALIDHCWCGVYFYTAVLVLLLYIVFTHCHRCITNQNSVRTLHWIRLRGICVQYFTCECKVACLVYLFISDITLLWKTSLISNLLETHYLICQTRQQQNVKREQLIK